MSIFYVFVACRMNSVSFFSDRSLAFFCLYLKVKVRHRLGGGGVKLIFFSKNQPAKMQRVTKSNEEEVIVAYYL